MTRNDYFKVGRVLRNVRQGSSHEILGTVIYITEKLIQEFEKDDPSFDSKKFRDFVNGKTVSGNK